MNAVSPLAQFDGAMELIASWFKGMAPDPPELVGDWAERDNNIVLTPEMSAEPGPYSLSRTPFLREILTNLSPLSPVIGTVLMKGSQVGASQAGLAFLVYLIAVAGGPSLVVCPTVKAAELFAKQRLEPLIRGCEPAAKKLPENKGKKTGNTILLKVFPGGIMRLVGAGSVNPLKSMPVKVVFFEEPDEFATDLEGQGNATGIVLRRITTFGKRAKWYAPCTPGLQSRSIVYALFMDGDQREYRMPCPHCGFLTSWNKDTIRFEKGRPETAHMVCESVECGKPIHEGRNKTAMMDAGVWVPKIKDAPPDMPRSYYLPAFYSPWETWALIAKAIEAAEGNYEASKLLWNQTYGLPWKDVAERPNYEALFQRAKASPWRMRQVPPWVVFLTAGIDVGIDHIEIGVWGFGRKGRRHLVEHVRIRGSKGDPETWAKAEAFLQRRYLHPCGAVLQLRRAGVDRGKWPEVVVPWVRKQDPEFIVAVRGNEKPDAQILKESIWRERGIDGRWTGEGGFVYWTLGVGMLKLELYTYLNLPAPREDQEMPPGYISLPNDVTLDWCEQLVSEEYAEHKNKKSGKTVMVWQKVGGARGEALDTANYARAMAELCGWSYWSDADFLREEAALEAHAEDIRRRTAQLQARRLQAGDTRPVRLEDLPVSNVVYPEGAEPVPAAPEPIVIPEAPAAAKPAGSNATLPRGLRATYGGEGAVERPAEIGVVGKAVDKVDFRALMRKAGMGRQQSHDDI